jgi:hypothetical protein
MTGCRGFETRWRERFLSIYLIVPAALGPEVYLTSKRNEYQRQEKKMFLGSRSRPVRQADLTAISEPIV